MDRELASRPTSAAGEFHRAGSRESTRVARAISRPPPIPAEALARVKEIEEAGATLYVSAPHRLPPELAELAEVQEPEALGVELEPVEIPLPTGRSLIPSDVLEAIAREESDLLAEEAFAEQEAAADRYDEDEHLEVDDEALQIVCEEVAPGAALALLRTTEVLRGFPEGALELLAEDAVRVHLEDGQAAVREGAAADSFFVVEHGALEKLRVDGPTGELALGQVERGEPFGLFGLLTRKVRTATVRSRGASRVVELRAAQLDAVARAFPTARRELARYFQERLLESFVSVSPLFPELDALGRAALVSHFQDRKVAAGEVLLSPGEVQTGLALVTSGRLVVSRRDGPGRVVELANLCRGEFYGVVSALGGLPTRTRIAATEPCTVCMLPQRAFNEFLKGYPSLRELPVRLAEAGEQVERDVFVGDATGLA